MMQYNTPGIAPLAWGIIPNKCHAKGQTTAQVKISQEEAKRKGRTMLMTTTPKQVKSRPTTGSTTMESELGKPADAEDLRELLNCSIFVPV